VPWNSICINATYSVQCTVQFIKTSKAQNNVITVTVFCESSV